MKFLVYSLTMIFLASISVSAADNQFKIRRMEGGWFGATKQTDPFDESKTKVYQISKGDFTFTCRDLNMESRSYGFDSFSFGALMKYKIDDQAHVEKKGFLSTYLGGSKMVTDNSYFSFKLKDSDIDAMKAGTSIKVAGKHPVTGWETKELSLIGFSSAYDQMCK